MQAIQPSRPPLEPNHKRPHKPRPKKHLRQRSHQVMALETTAKIGVNVLISAAAISALANLIPHNWVQQDKLRTIRTQVGLMETRVNTIKTEFNRNFDPTQTNRIMQEQGYRIDPNQHPIVFTHTKDTNEVDQSSDSP
jgi:hypothetical protein